MTQITIPNETISVTYSVVSSSSGPFVVPFRFFVEEDVIAIVTDALGAVTNMVVTTHFTFTQLDVPEEQEGSGFTGGEITLEDPIGSDGDTTIEILRSIIIDRSSNFPNTGPFSMALLNDEQNRFIAIMQELAVGQANGGGGVPNLDAVTATGKTTTWGIDLITGAEQEYYDTGDGAWTKISQVGDNLEIRAGLGTSKNIHLIPISGGIVRIDGPLSVKEFASAPDDVAAYGQTWVRLETPNVPVFTDDTGVDQLIDPSVSEINVQNGDYTTVITDKGKTISKESGDAGETYTIDSHANVPYKTGTFLAFNNDGGGDLTIAITDDTLVFADDNTTGSRTLADGGYAIAQKVAQTTWKIAGKQLT